MNAPAGLSSSALLRYFRKSGRLIIGEVAGDLWVSDAYMAARLVGEKNPIANLLALYNLPCEPMSCRVDGTVVKEGDKGVEMEKLLPTVKSLVPATRFCIGSAPVLVEGSLGGEWLELWQAGDQRLCMNPRIRQMVDLFAPGDWQASPTNTATRPLAKVIDRKVAAIAMPVRNLATMTDEGKAA